VAFTYIYEDTEASALVEQLQSKGVQVLCLQSDASSFESAHAVVTEVVNTFGQLDILVCNAGIAQDTLLMRMTENQWDTVLNINLKSVFNYCHAATPQMMRQRSGSIIAMSSIVGIGGNAGQANYAASKAGIIGFIKSLSKELGSRNIRANAIAPGFITTDMTDKLNDATKEAIISSVSLGRMGTTDEIANVALFLASDMSSYITGETIKVTGGMR
jgi:3-oxoacyl-[acyl-carrier protein] reductase